MSPAGKNKKSGRGWRLLALATVVFFIGAGIYFLFITVGESKRIEQTLIDRHGWANHYTPPMDGSVPANRLERFIRVRAAVQPNCVILQRILFEILNLEAIEESEDLSTGEKMSESLGSFKSMFSFAPSFLEFMDARNLALLAEEMGIGEYIYLALAKRTARQHAPGARPVSRSVDGSLLQRNRQDGADAEKSRLEF